MVTTDGFIYPNSVLMERQILNRKGFPESYNMELLLNFLDSIKNGMTAEIPVYSHEIYDILPDEKQVIQSPDFLILEGINVFQNQKNTRLYMTGYFDFSIYIDADINNIKKWYLERFDSLLELAKTDKNNYYHRFVHMEREDVLKIAEDTWGSINLVNLKKYIEPTRNRAELILHKASDHKIDRIYLKK